MKVKSLSIEGYKGFEKKTDIDFNDHLNVFIGDNGSGKSTILSAIARCLIKYTTNFVKIEGAVTDELIEFSNQDINYNADFLAVILHVEDQLNSDFAIPIIYYVGYVNDYPSTVDHRLLGFSRDAARSYYDAIKTRGSSTTWKEIPIIKYYPAKEDKYHYKNNNNKQHYRIPQLEIWSNIYSDRFSIAKFTDWYYHEENRELRLQKSENQYIENQQLSGIRKAVKELYYDLTGKKYDLSITLIDTNKGNETIPVFGLINVDAPNDIILSSNMSDGQLRVFLFVADLAYNISISKFNNEPINFKTAPGIVLIDEIETHLHPKWQREILPILTKIYPSIQFFITTHSPQVISSVASENLLLCDDFKVSNINVKTKGVDSNQLLTHIFGATERPVQYIELLNRLHEAIDNEATTDVLDQIYENAKQLVEDSGDEGENMDTFLEELQDLIHATHYFND